MRFIITAGLFLATACPILSLTFTSEIVEANFDDLRPGRNAFQSEEVQRYARLQWDGFSVDSPRINKDDDFRGVEVKSLPNYAGGRMDAFGGLPTITTNYASSQVAFFDLERFWWGCSTKDETTGGPKPGWCTLEIRGYSHEATEPTAKAVSFFFPKEGVKTMEMVEATMPASFKAVSRVEFAVIATNPTLFVDNVKYTIYNVTSIGRGLAEVIHSQRTSNGQYQRNAIGHEVKF